MFHKYIRFSAALGAVASVAIASTLPASEAASLQPGGTVNVVPSMDTPQVRNGRIQALAQVGNLTVLGGTFTQVADAGGTAVTRTYLAAYDRTTHKLSRTFAPVINGQVWAVIPGAAPNSVYIGGDFTQVNGVAATRVAAVDLTTGAKVPGFQPSAANGTVRALGLSGGKLFVGGTFSKVGNVAHAGLASLDPKSGKVTDFANQQFAENHSWGKVAGANKMPVGVVDLAISPDGQQLTAIGNFRRVDGTVHDQIVQLAIGGTTSSVIEDWNTPYFTAACYSWAFDSWVRDVAYSPDGSYFVVGSTGGSNNDLCDAIGRFETSGRGSVVQPTWIASTGGDSIYAMAVTDSAIYAGGHFRWFNNPYAVDRAGAGAVPRPGLVALDPTTGIPLPWNPGRHPRDKGVFAILATDTDLTIGTDTEWIGNKLYRTYRLSNFPIAGGARSPQTSTPELPAQIARLTTGGSNESLQTQALSADGGLDGSILATTDVPLKSVKGAVTIGDQVFIANADGTLERRTLKSGVFSARTVVDPYNDPAWMNVKTGLARNTETYRGIDSGFASLMPRLTSLFFVSGKIYYTLSGSSQLYSRSFEPGSGIISPVVTTVPGVSLPELAGGTWASGSFFYARASDGMLVSQPFNGISMGVPTVVSLPGTDWRSQALFVTPAE
ncbi:MAG: hypothetical protein L0H96_15475 [Humibacillus sp.]|nr:hypothetical protein [Humibacillus sp.]